MITENIFFEYLHLYESIVFFFSIKCLESYGIVKNSNGTFHPTEFHLPVGISKAFQFDLTCLNICRIILKFHLACDVKVDPCCVANLAVIVDSYRGWSHEISGNSQFFSLKREINSMTQVVVFNLKRGRYIALSWKVLFLINQCHRLTPSNRCKALGIPAGGSFAVS